MLQVCYNIDVIILYDIKNTRVSIDWKRIF